MSSENVTHINVSLFGSLTCQGRVRGSSRVYVLAYKLLLITIIIIYLFIYLFYLFIYIIFYFSFFLSFFLSLFFVQFNKDNITTLVQ